MKTTQPKPATTAERWVTDPFNRPRCPKHNARLVAFAGRGVIGLCRCPVAGCSYRQKVARVKVEG
jgi:hypothetical protein